MVWLGKQSNKLFIESISMVLKQIIESGTRKKAFHTKDSIENIYESRNIAIIIMKLVLFMNKISSFFSFWEIVVNNS